jgi:hypothetical protein
MVVLVGSGEYRREFTILIKCHGNGSSQVEDSTLTTDSPCLWGLHIH